jgi:hypothetical protein
VSRARAPLGAYSPRDLLNLLRVGAEHGLERAEMHFANLRAAPFSGVLTGSDDGGGADDPSVVARLRGIP